MRFNLRNFLIVFGPVILISLFDISLKLTLLKNSVNLNFFLFKINVVANTGIIGGAFSNHAKPLFQIPLISVGFLLLVGLYFIQLFSPIRSTIMRLAISFFIGGIFSNVLDRLLNGYVIDYLILDLKHWASPALNFADLVQIVSMTTLFIWQFFSTSYDENYSEKIWVSEKFQRRYSFQLVKLGLALLSVFGVLSIALIRYILDEINVVQTTRSTILNEYLMFFGSLSAVFLCGLYLLGRHLSSYVAQPIVRFENYLKDLARGEYHIFQVNEPDFQYLEALSDEVRDHIMGIQRNIRRLEIRLKRDVKIE